MATRLWMRSRVGSVSVSGWDSSSVLKQRVMIGAS